MPSNASGARLIARYSQSREREAWATVTRRKVVAHPHASDGVELARLAEERAALRRVATPVAQGAEPSSLFAVVAEQVARVLRVPFASVVRFEDDGTVVQRASHSDIGTVLPSDTRWTLDGRGSLAQVQAHGKPARIEDYSGMEGEIADYVRRVGIRSTVAVPIVVAGRMWGAMVVSATEPALPADTEARLTDFTELLATAIASSESQEEVARLAEEQAALRRVATLVAHGVPPDELCGAVAAEVGRLLGTDLAGISRYDADDLVTHFPAWSAAGEPPDMTGRVSRDTEGLSKMIRDTGRPARLDDWHELTNAAQAFKVRSAVGGPIVVENRVWGKLVVASTQAQLAPDTESRLMAFTELVATAIANADARGHVQRLADEQAALRRVATLVARGAPESEVLAAVAEEVSRLFPGRDTQINRYEAEAAVCVARTGTAMPLGTRIALDGDSVSARVFRTGRPARIGRYEDVPGWVGDYARAQGVQSTVGVPIVVDARLWGMIGSASLQPDDAPQDTESRMAQFAELVATAISNLQARADLAASRARVVAAADDERRRVVRDLHDGAQQRLVHTVITLKLAQQAFENRADDAPALLGRAVDQAEHAMVEVRELAHGILPSVLTHGGLGAGIDALASRMMIPVQLDVSVGRLPRPIEATAYFVVAEALTNVSKHSAAERAKVSAHVEDGMLLIGVHDDGVGGARADGTGLVGLADRLAAVEGQLEFDSPADGGTRVAAVIPLSTSSEDAAAT
jgi:signal transduction histidine kinase